MQPILRHDHAAALASITAVLEILSIALYKHVTDN